MERGVFDRPRIALAAGMFLTLSFLLIWQALGVNPDYHADPVVVTALLTAIVGLVGVEALSLRKVASDQSAAIRARLLEPKTADRGKGERGSPTDQP